MANEKILNTRVQLKFDSLAKWQASVVNGNDSSKYLKAGELAIISTGENKDGSASGLHPILFKVGDGEHKFDDLPFASALAADVYSWAKKEGIEVIDNGTGKFVTDVSWDSNNNAIVITRADESKDYGKVTADEGEIAADAFHDTFAIKGEGVVSTKAANDTVTISVNLSEYAKTADLPQIPDVTATGDSEVILSAEGHHVSGSHALHAEGSANASSTSTISGYEATGTINIPKIVTNAAGHVTSIREETIAIEFPAAVIDTNTITTVSGDGKYIKVERTDGENDTRDYKVSAIEDELKNLIGTVTTAAMDFKGVTASLPTEAVKGDMYKVTGIFVVGADNDAQGKGFTTEPGDSIVCDGDNKWYLIPSGDDVEDTWRHVKVNNKQILDNAVNANNPLEITNGTDSADKYAKFTVNGEVVKAEVVGYQEAGNYKTEQEAYTAEGSTIQTVTKVEQNANGEVTITYENIAFPAPPVVNDGKFTVSGINALTGSGSMTANQAGDTVANLDIADKGVTTAKIADHAIGAHQTKACKDYEDNADAEIWVFYCGSATELV